MLASSSTPPAPEAMGSLAARPRQASAGLRQAQAGLRQALPGPRRAQLVWPLAAAAAGFIPSARIIYTALPVNVANAPQMQTARSRGSRTATRVSAASPACSVQIAQTASFATRLPIVVCPRVR